MNKQLLDALSDWNNCNSCICDLLDVMFVLAGKKHEAISEILDDIVKSTEERTRAMVKLEAMGVENHDHALLLAAKYL